MKTPVTLQQYLLRELKDHPEQSALVMMMADLATIGKLLSAEVNRAGLSDLEGYAESTNVTNDKQANLDIWSNNLCINYLKASGWFAALASEEEETVIDLESPKAEYVIAFDPLDGSSNIDVNVCIGTIFSVLRKLPNLPAGDERQFFQTGREQVLAGYILYSTSTMIVFSWGDGVHAFTLDKDLGEFMLSNDHVKIPAKAQYYSFNESYARFISEEDQAYMDMVRAKTDKQRYIGSLVGDFHRNMLKGGVYAFPAVDPSNKGEFKPKLRLNYEAKPMAFLAEQSGGLATNGKENILDIVPTSLHEHVALFMGNKELVKE